MIDLSIQIRLCWDKFWHRYFVSRDKSVKTEYGFIFLRGQRGRADSDRAQWLRWRQQLGPPEDSDHKAHSHREDEEYHDEYHCYEETCTHGIGTGLSLLLTYSALWASFGVDLDISAGNIQGERVRQGPRVLTLHLNQCCNELCKLFDILNSIKVRK